VGRVSDLPFDCLVSHVIHFFVLLDLALLVFGQVVTKVLQNLKIVHRHVLLVPSHLLPLGRTTFCDFFH
jgi:hypothetical protein